METYDRICDQKLKIEMGSYEGIIEPKYKKKRQRGEYVKVRDSMTTQNHKEDK